MPVRPAVVKDDPRALDAVFADSFFEPWLIKGLYLPMDQLSTTRKGRRFCDYALSFGSTLILIDVHQATFDAHFDLLTEWTQFRKVALPNSRRRLGELEQHISQTVLYQDVACTEPLVVQPAQIYKLCITGAYEQLWKNQFSAILHSYGARFYAEDFVLDEEENPLLVYSLGDFATLIEQLCSFADLFDFLQFHRRAILCLDEDYASELDLLERYIDCKQPFRQAKMLEHEWLMQHLKYQESKLLLLAREQPAKAFYQAWDTSVLWRQLIGHYAHYAKQALLEDDDHAVDWVNLRDLLADESIVSQAHLAQAMINQAGMSAAADNDGYIVHLRSYQHAKRHYILFFYAQVAGQRYSREQMIEELPVLARQVNAQEQAPCLDEIVVLGIQSDAGQFVAADIAYVEGYAVPEAERVYRGQRDAVGQVVNQPIASSLPISRHAFCPCGSGRRYKHCCGRASS
jgi:hypothetical protein